MAYTAPQIGTILLKADRTMYKIGQIAYENMFAEDNEALDYERDIIFIYKKAVEFADDFFVGTEKLDKVVERLAAKISAYDYGELNPIYADAALLNISTVVAGAALNDLTDVTITNVQDNQILRYNSVTGQWINVGPGSAVRNSQAFTATAGQTVFTTSFPFDAGLFDLYLNGVKLNSSSYTTFGEYQITLNDACLVGDIVDVVIFDPNTSILPSINSLDDLVDVSLGALVNNQVLYYNSATGLWQNGTVSGGVWGSITGTLSNQTDLQNALNAKYNNPTGTAAQYIRGDGQLANFPDNQGGGSAYNYYLNGSVNQGTFGGDVYYEMSKTPVLGAGTNFTRTNAQGNGYIASFITDAGDPSLLNIPAGNWNVEFYFQANTNAGNPQFYAELYKVSSSNVFTLVASGSSNPEGITNGTTVDQYYTAISVPQTSLLVTDRLAVRIYVIPAGRTITLHTENSNLCEILTTFSTGLNALNGLTAQVQYFATGTSGTDFGISSATDTHTFNLPTASSVNRGALSSADWTTFNNKVPASRTLTINGVAFDLSADRTWTVAGGISGSGASGQVAYWTGTSAQAGSNDLFWDTTNGRLGIGTSTPNASGVLHVDKSQNIPTSIFVTNSNTGISAQSQIRTGLNPSNFNVDYTSIGILGTNHPTVGVLKAKTGLIENFGSNLIISNYNDSEPIIFATGTSRVAKMQLFSGGNLVLQNGGTFTDGGQRLQVQGTTLLNGNVTFSSSTGMTWDATNARLNFGGTLPTNVATQNIVYSTSLVGVSVKNTSSASGVTQCGFYVENNLGHGGQLYKTGGSYTTYKTISASDLGFYNATAGNISILNDSATGNIILTAGASSTAHMTLHNTGNLLLGSTTNTGERLQVTGTCKLAGATTITTTATQLTLDYPGQNTTTFTVASNGVFTINPRGAGASGSLVYGGSSVQGWAVGGTDFRGVLTVQKSFTDVYALNTDPADPGRVFVMQNNSTTNAVNQFSNITMQINATASLSGGRILGDFRLVRKTSNQSDAFFMFSAFRQGATYKDYFKLDFDNSWLSGSLAIGSQSDPTAIADIASSSASRASLRIRSGTAPTSPNDGDIWYDGTNIYMRVGATTKTFTLI